jgi:hypothetical protein
MIHYAVGFFLILLPLFICHIRCRCAATKSGQKMEIKFKDHLVGAISNSRKELLSIVKVDVQQPNK